MLDNFGQVCSTREDDEPYWIKAEGDTVPLVRQNLLHASDSELTEAGEDLVLGIIFAQIQEIQALIPAPEARPIPPGRLRKLGRHIMKVSEAPYEPYPPYIVDEVDTSMSKKMARKVRRLNELLTELAADPYDLPTELYIGNERDFVRKDAADELEWQLAASNAQLLRRIDMAPKTKTKRRPTVITHTAVSPVPADEKTQPEDPIRQSEALLAECGITTVGDFSLTVPWRKNSAPTTISRMKAPEGSVLFARALDERLEDIADTVRAKSPRSNGDLNVFDQIAQHLAKRVASGIMPWQSANSVKRVRARSSEQGPEYKDVSIWYSFDVSPNAPRVYFTLKEAAEIMDTKEAAGEIEPDEQCLVVIAETDKANQTSVLKVLTGKGHRRLRRNGSGAV